MRVYLAIYLVSAHAGFGDPEYSGVTLRFPSEQACQEASQTVNQLGDIPETGLPDVMYASQSLVMIGECKDKPPEEEE